VLADVDLQSLRNRLAEVDYTVDRIVDLIGAEAHAALGRNNTTPALRVLRGTDDPVATLTRLWPLQSTVGVDDLDRALPGLRGPLTEAGIVEVSGDQAKARIDLRPYASDETAPADGTGDDPALRAKPAESGERDDRAGGYWVFSDLTPGLDGPMTPVRPDFVLGVSPASLTLAEMTVRRPVGTALDLGTGCGVQSLHLARHADRVVATDVNERALAMARATFRLNGIDRVDVRSGSLYEPVAGESFDLIVTNPPYVMSPPARSGDRLTYREAGMVGDELVRQVVVDGAARLNPGGTLQVLGNWAQPVGRLWQERLEGWVAGTGCDAHIVRREVLDAYSYIEIWLTDAGLLGQPEYTAAYDRWCSYFEDLGIESVGMGWLMLTRAGRQQPVVTVEDWPHPVEQPIGPAWGRRQQAVELVQGLSDAEILSRRWKLAADVAEETVGRPGAADPEAIVFRQQRGFRRATRAGTALAAVVGACDGDLTLGQIVGGVATLLEVDPVVLGDEIVDDIRVLIVDNLLTDVK
jgi:methylase of polypeptide subunit release factors